jgi:hypothetical protein
MNGLKRGPRLFSNLSSLTRLALPAPGCNVRLHSNPNEPGCNHTPRSPDPWVGHSVNSLENLPPILLRNQRPRATCREITQEANPLQLTCLNLERRIGLCLLGISTASLPKSQPSEVGGR